MIVPSSLMSIVAPVSSVIARIVVPPLPMTSRILSGWILHRHQARRELGSSARAADDALSISPRMCRRPSRGLRQRHLHDLFGDAVDLDVHLQRA